MKNTVSETSGERRILGALMTIGAMTLIPTADGIGKNMMDSLPPLQVICGRFVAHFLWVAPFVIFRYRAKLFNQFNPRGQFIRAAFLFLSAFLYMLSLAEIPLARAIALFAIAPFVVAALSFAVLGERVRAAAVFCIVGGFFGVLCIARPDTGFHIYNMVALVSGILYGFFILASRKVAGSAPPMVGSFYVGAVGGLSLSCILLFSETKPLDTHTLYDFVLMGGLTALAHYLLARAFDFARAAFLSLFLYWEIAAGIVIGFVLHNDIPDFRDWIGIVVIMFFGIVLIVRDKAK